MRFREVERNIDTEKLNNVYEKKEEGYMQIKPETDMTIDEATSFLESLFK